MLRWSRKNFFYYTILLKILFFFNCYAEEDRAIYGKDTRRDIGQTTEFYRKLSRSVAVKISQSSFERKGFRFRFLDLDRRERFSHWPSASTCTAFLIAPDKLMTAGHCMKYNKKTDPTGTKSAECKTHDWVFDYYYDDQFDYDRNDLIPYSSSSQRYSCQKIILQKSEDGYDYAIIQLDRPVIGRDPLLLNIRKQGDIPLKDQELFVIGSPSGFPLIYSAGQVTGHMLLDRKKGDFRLLANLDTFQGNSGSPVFSSSGVVEGILVSGREDYDDTGHAIHYSEHQGGEGVFPLNLVPNLTLHLSTPINSKLPIDQAIQQDQIFEALKLQHQEAYVYLRDYLKKMKKVNLEILNSEKWTPLMVAVDKGYFKVVELFLSYKAQMEGRTPRGSTPLILAVWAGNQKTAKILIEKGANINAKTNNGSTALMKASEEGYVDLVKLLLTRRDIDLRSTNQLGRTALFLAKERGHEEIYYLLFNALKK